MKMVNAGEILYSRIIYDKDLMNRNTKSTKLGKDECHLGFTFIYFDIKESDQIIQ